MPCPMCASTATREQARPTALGYRTFRCAACRCRFIERTGTPFNFLEYPTDIVLLVVRWRLPFKLSLRDLARMFLERDYVFTHEALRDWEARFAPLFTARLRTKRQGNAGKKWYVDETYVQVQGRSCYLSRAIDRDGNLVDSLLSETRDMAAAMRFLARALQVVGHYPEQVTTDGHTAYPRAIREILGEAVEHRCSPYLNNHLEQDHRGIKQRYYPMRGFGSVAGAVRFCTAHDELRDHRRARQQQGETVPLAAQRRIYLEKLAEVGA